LISNIPIVSNQYWNSIHEKKLSQADMDEEGKTNVLARNMSFLIKCIALGKEQIGLPEAENIYGPFHHVISSIMSIFIYYQYNNCKPTTLLFIS